MSDFHNMINHNQADILDCILKDHSRLPKVKQPPALLKEDYLEISLVFDLENDNQKYSFVQQKIHFPLLFSEINRP